MKKKKRALISREQSSFYVWKIRDKFYLNSPTTLTFYQAVTCEVLIGVVIFQEMHQHGLKIDENESFFTFIPFHESAFHVTWHCERVHARITFLYGAQLAEESRWWQVLQDAVGLKHKGHYLQLETHRGRAGRESREATRKTLPLKDFQEENQCLMPLHQPAR